MRLGLGIYDIFFEMLSIADSGAYFGIMVRTVFLTPSRRVRVAATMPLFLGGVKQPLKY